MLADSWGVEYGSPEFIRKQQELKKKNDKSLLLNEASGSAASNQTSAAPDVIGSEVFR